MVKNLDKKIITLILISSLCGCAGNRTSAFAKSLLNNDRRPTNIAKSDQYTASKVISMLAKEQKLWDNSHISAASYNKSLLLIGQTNSEDNLKLIEKIVSSIPEIDTVYNQVKVKNPIGFRARAKDAWITTQVKAKLLSEPNIGPNRIKVYTEDGIVYLMGILTNDEEHIATETTNSVSGVKSVVKVLDRLSLE
jgi:osmotically-inducible protein OsmY